MVEGRKNIVWIASYPKSGNTWFRIFLDNLFSDSEEPVNINELGHSFIASSRALFDRFSGVNSSDLTEKEIQSLRPEVYRYLSIESPRNLYIKVHDAWGLNNDGVPLFPEDVTKLVVYLIRNPLEVAVSYAFHSNIAANKIVKRLNSRSGKGEHESIKLWSQLKEELQSWSDHVLSWTKNSGLPVHIIKYEDMLSDAYNALSAPLTKMGIEASGEKISKAISNSCLTELKKQEKKYGFKEKYIHSKSFFRDGSNISWKHILDKKDIQSVIHTHKEVMKAYGYLSEHGRY